MEGSPVPKGDEYRYFSALWLQRENGKVTRAWTAIPCQDMFDEYEVSMMFY